MPSKPLVRLREFEEADLPGLKRLREDVDTQHLLLAHPAHGALGLADVADWVARRRAEPSGAFQIVADERGDAIGFVQIANVHRLDRIGEGGICLLPESRGRRLGRAAMLLLMQIAFGRLGLRKLLLNVRADNTSALALYGRLGFRTVGRLAEHYDDGQARHDVVLLELLNGTQASR
jgi:RimJ/RimL family protein N-acetyltransferase